MEDKETLFDFEQEDKAEDIIGKAQSKSRLRIITISTLVAAGVIGLGLLLKMQVTPMVFNKEVKEEHMYQKIYGANTYLGQWEKYVSLTESRGKAVRYKLVDGVVVPIGEIRLPKGTKSKENTVINEQGEVFGVNGLRMMMFYHPEASYTAYPNALETLDQIGADKVVELGLSFDKAYDVEAVEAMLPEGVKLQWSWVDIYDETYLQQEENSPWSEEEVVGIDYLKADGESVEEPEQAFFQDLENAIQSSGKKYRDNFLGIQESVEAEGLRVLGVVVTGSPEQLKALKGQPFVKAASLGAIADRY